MYKFPGVLIYFAVMCGTGLELRNLSRRAAPLERSHRLLRLTHSGRFLLRRMPHWGNASLIPRKLYSRDSTTVE